MMEINMVRNAKPNHYVKVSCFDNTRRVESCALSFIVQRPSFEPGFKLIRQEGQGRKISYTLESYATTLRPEGARYTY